MNKKKIAIILGSVIGLGLLGYLGYTLYKNSKLKSNDPNKDNRVVQFKR